MGTQNSGSSVDTESVKTKRRGLFSKEADEGYVPNRELFAYSAALAGQNLTYQFVTQWLFYFCTDVLKIGARKVGFFTGFSRIWDALNDPIVGAVIDRRKCKNGKKLHPYLGKLPIFIGILTALMFVDFGVGETAAMVIILCVYIGWDFTYSFQDVALWGMMSLISPHPHERARVSQWLNIGVGAACGAISLIPMIMGAREKIGISEKLLFLIFGIVFGLGGELMSILAYKTKERVEFVTPPKQSLLKDIAMLRYNKILILLLLAQILNFFNGAIAWIYFFKYCVSVNIGGKVINGETVQFYYGILVSAFSAVSMFFAVKLADKLGGMKNMVVLAQVMNAAFRVVAFFIGFDTLPKMIAVIAIISVSSVPTNMVGIAQRALLCDSIDYTEWKTGKRTEGISNSMQNLTNKFVDALKLIFSGLVLSGLGYDANLGLEGQTQAFYKAQWPLFMLLPALGSVLYLIPFLCIRYSKAQRAQVEKDLAERHAESLAMMKPNPSNKHNNTAFYVYNSCKTE